MTPYIPANSYFVGPVTVKVNLYSEEQVASLIAERDALKAQLPEGMKHCTIMFKECDKGHGWLTATNWVQHSCPQCEIDALKADAARYRFIRSTPNADVELALESKSGDALDAAIDAVTTVFKVPTTAMFSVNSGPLVELELVADGVSWDNGETWHLVYRYASKKDCEKSLEKK